MRKIKSFLLIIVGLIIGSSIGITAITYVLKSSEIQYTDNKSVQEAIDELYILANNIGGEVKDLILIPEVLGSNINISYTGTYQFAYCVYGTDETYGNRGTLEGNKCIISGTPNVTYYYKITTLNNDGEIYSGSGSSKTNAGATVVKNGLPVGTKAIIYLDPTNLGATCNEQNSIVGGTSKSGCMKWYAFKEDDSSYTMILDHNTTASIGHNDEQTDINNILQRLQLDAADWIVTPRLITGYEIANIVGKSWTSSPDVYENRINFSEYYWLYDYTNGCTRYGCKVADSSTYGYWTSNLVKDWVNYRCWYVNYQGNLYYYDGDPTYRGIRPVIIVQKSSL